VTKTTIPDVAEPLLAFRVWAWDRGMPLAVWSLNAKPPKRTRARGQLRRLLTTPDGAWPTDAPLPASCSAQTKDGDSHEPPSEKCSCGIYAATAVDIVAQYIREAPVLGLVQGSGTVIPADFGFRAERVHIACLFDIAAEFTIPRRDLQRLADAYNVPLIRPHSAKPDDYRHGVRSRFAAGWHLDFGA
jgi:hypothetical protein